ncbi:hypothetical protein B0H19DRAFT_1241089 [Mycena capillaripes]|nr:hypothetical protein B0H19DRAFT_1241089 [Mycena capillaripes]
MRLLAFAAFAPVHCTHQSGIRASLIVLAYEWILAAGETGMGRRQRSAKGRVSQAEVPRRVFIASTTAASRIPLRHPRTPTAACAQLHKPMTERLSGRHAPTDRHLQPIFFIGHSPAIHVARLAPLLDRHSLKTAAASPLSSCDLSPGLSPLVQSLPSILDPAARTPVNPHAIERMGWGYRFENQSCHGALANENERREDGSTPRARRCIRSAPCSRLRFPSVDADSIGCECKCSLPVQVRSASIWERRAGRASTVLFWDGGMGASRWRVKWMGCVWKERRCSGKIKAGRRDRGLVKPVTDLSTGILSVDTSANYRERRPRVTRIRPRMSGTTAGCGVTMPRHDTNTLLMLPMYLTVPCNTSSNGMSSSSWVARE